MNGLTLQPVEGDPFAPEDVQPEDYARKLRQLQQGPQPGLSAPAQPPPQYLDDPNRPGFPLLQSIADDPSYSMWARVPAQIGSSTANVFQGLMRGAFEAVPRGVYHLAQLTGEALKGRVDPNSPEAVRQAVGAIGDITLAGAGGHYDPNALGVFVGAKAANADMAAIARAQEMTARGEKPMKIWQSTGWFLGADGQWKKEIPDQPSRLQTEPLAQAQAPNREEVAQRIYDQDRDPSLSWNDVLRRADQVIATSGQQQRTLGEILHHPELYAAHPDLAQLPVRVRDMPGYRGMYYPAGQGETERIELSRTLIPDPSQNEELQRAAQQQAHETILHEAQHGIQRREGFAPGANLGTYPASGTPSPRWERWREAVQSNHPDLTNYLKIRRSEKYQNDREASQKYFDEQVQPALEAAWTPGIDAKVYAPIANQILDAYYAKRKREWPTIDRLENLGTKLQAAGIPTQEPPRLLDPRAAYHATAGEAEARNVVNRLTSVRHPESRFRRDAPWLTQDVPDIDQLGRQPPTFEPPLPGISGQADSRAQTKVHRDPGVRQLQALARGAQSGRLRLAIGDDGLLYAGNSGAFTHDDLTPGDYDYAGDFFHQNGAYSFSLYRPGARGGPIDEQHPIAKRLEASGATNLNRREAPQAEMEEEPRGAPEDGNYAQRLQGMMGQAEEEPPRPRLTLTRVEGDPFASPTGTFGPLSPEAFIAARNKSTRSGFLSPLEPSDIGRHTLFANREHTVGAAIDPDGDIQNVFNNGGPKGAGGLALAEAIRRGGRTLDAYDGYLNDFYHQFGFEETGRMKFNPAFAHGWDPVEGTPDVVFMAWKGYPEGGEAGALERSRKPRDAWVPNVKSTRYEDDYDAAKQRARDASVHTRAIDERGTGRDSGAGALQGSAADRSGGQSLAEAGARSGRDRLDDHPYAHPWSQQQVTALSKLRLMEGEAPYAKGSRNVTQAARDLVARAQQHLRAMGVRGGKITLANATPAHNEMLAHAIADEAEAALRETGHAGDWYTAKVEEALRVAALAHPEILEDTEAGINARSALAVAMAITSQGETVNMNTKLAEEAYANRDSLGRFPETMPASKLGPDMLANFKKYNRLVEKWGQSGATEYLSRPMTVRELNADGAKFTDLPKDTMVTGSAMFGAKIGNGFYQNLMGNFDPVTQDLWFMRTWGRLAGTLMDTLTPEGLAAATTKFADALREAGHKVPRTRQGLYTLARGIFKQHERDYARYGAEYKSGARIKGQLQLKAQALVRGIDGIMEDPGGGKLRLWRQGVVNRAREMLAERGLNMTNADVQATIWYPEKTLYERLGSKGPIGGLADYSTAFARLMRAKGYTDAEIAAARAGRQ